MSKRRRKYRPVQDARIRRDFIKAALYEACVGHGFCIQSEDHDRIMGTEGINAHDFALEVLRADGEPGIPGSDYYKNLAAMFERHVGPFDLAESGR